MDNLNDRSLDYEEYIEIANGVYWVGYADASHSLHCNPYLVVEGDEAVLIDGGSRNDFSTVMLKILRTGTRPESINRLIYQHYDPDLCGSIPHLEAIIRNPDLQLISHRHNNHFIHYYDVQSPLLCIEQIGMKYTFRSGRELRFFRIPYAHTPGSFITYDTATRVLFSSDLFGSYDTHWELYAVIDERCDNCVETGICPRSGMQCPIEGILQFHRVIMNDVHSLRYALDVVDSLDLSMIAPQHGGLLGTRESQQVVIRRLRAIKEVGFAYFLEHER